MPVVYEKDLDEGAERLLKFQRSIINQMAAYIADLEKELRSLSPEAVERCIAARRATLQAKEAVDYLAVMSSGIKPRAHQSDSFDLPIIINGD
ncbi:hypothetical protein [Falsigemmobacter faecalis]|uniref:Uncharacterized protein n=1 Tax=Falsigemmobacter faecalis TaxID=2488730 RepID=A0A3P3DAA2_9RHOB|nr:hypothetical protein [Falsigemmobacter faecalis]RRH71265.1 hypothetical protein EG244_16445 [Falsigemmobacter faecalis]